MSPLAASAHYLGHLKAAWDAANPETPLSGQEVVLTVPASFDAAARELTVEAAAQIGLQDNLRLLEEPQAALYAWLADKGDAWRDELNVGDTILVCDIGGGTTDFSLISVQEEDGVLQLERIAVGDHILLGGDNMDLALAYGSQQSLSKMGNAWTTGRCVAWSTAAVKPKRRCSPTRAAIPFHSRLQAEGASSWVAPPEPNSPALSWRPRFWRGFFPQLRRRMSYSYRAVWVSRPWVFPMQAMQP